MSRLSARKCVAVPERLSSYIKGHSWRSGPNNTTSILSAKIQEMTEISTYRHKLTWSTPIEPLPTPEGIERVFLPTPDGVLDLHFCPPDTTSSTSAPRPPILFVHGGFGSALCWKNFLPLFASKGYPAYAISLRGHGNSYNPGYWKMYWMPRKCFIEDVRYAIQHLKQNHPGLKPILAAHSAGGGVVQDLTAQGVEDIAGLVMLSPIPGYGSWGVNLNWMLLDPWSTLRMFVLHFFHPRSPLSSTSLVHAAFFSRSMPTSKVIEVEKQMATYESMSWPLSMMRQFVDPVRLVKNLGWGDSADAKVKKGPILVIAADEDKLMTLNLMQRLVSWYQTAILSISSQSGDRTEGRVALRVTKGNGHHMMLDVNWKESAELVLDWLEDKY
ncbi:hypothetical protein AX16_004553 [Volvariella volvacea WC 439]|nr:hypothetical protein AX16_004553 [Volvariella volvacea WC 439]